MCLHKVNISVWKDNTFCLFKLHKILDNISNKIEKLLKTIEEVSQPLELK